MEKILHYIILDNLYGRGKKIVILDLDNTLWGGIIGDIGWEKINIGGHNSQGESYTDFQTYLKSLKDRGILLSICSKNNEADVISVFRDNENMVLKENDFSCMKINWSLKPNNIKEIATRHANTKRVSLTGSSKIIEKIVNGKIQKFYQEVCLLEQTFVMDGKIKVNECISTFNKEHNEIFEINNYVIFKLGQE